MKNILRFSFVILLFITIFTLTSCAPLSIEKAKSRLEDMGYDAEILTDDEVKDFENLYGCQIKAAVYGTSGIKYVKVYQMKSQADVDKLMDTYSVNFGLIHIFANGKWVAISDSEIDGEKAIK